MMEHGWLVRLFQLLAKASGSGIHGDVAGMSVAELWGLYCHLEATDDQ